MASLWATVFAYLRDFLVTYGFLSGHCFHELFVKFNLANSACIKSFASRVLGSGIVVGSALVKLPQVFKILGQGSAEGISFLGCLLELAAVTANGAYSFHKGFAFSAYGEAVFLSVQTSLIGLLILWVGGKKMPALIFAALYSGLCYAILAPGLIPQQVILMIMRKRRSSITC